MNTILMSGFAAVAWGVADYGAALKTRTMSAIAVTGATLAAGAALAGVIVLVQHSPLPTSLTVRQSAVAAALTVVGLSALYKALGDGRISIVAPISATGVALPVLVGIVGGESLVWSQVGGIVVAISGMIVLIGSVGRGDGNVGGFRPIGLAIIASVGLGVFYLVDSGVRQGQVLWFVLMSQLMAAFVLGLVCLLRRTPPPPVADAGQLGLLGVLGMLAWLQATRALSAGPLSVTSTITALYPVVTVLLAIGMQRERLRPIQVAALVAVFVGIGGIAA